MDRRGFLAAATGAAVLVGSGWLDSSTARADAPLLPAPGEGIRCASKARGVALRSLAMTGSADLTCDIHLRAEADPNDSKARRLRILKHVMKGRSAEFGGITITQDAEDLRTVPTAPSTIRRKPGKPPRYALRLECHRLKVEVERLPADLRRASLPVDLGKTLAGAGPIAFVTTEPLILENDDLGSWRFHHHSLASRRSVGLALPQLPQLTVATIEPFTVDSTHVKS